MTLEIVVRIHGAEPRHPGAERAEAKRTGARLQTSSYPVRLRAARPPACARRLARAPHNGRLKGIWHTCLSQKQVFLGSTPRAATNEGDPRRPGAAPRSSAVGGKGYTWAAWTGPLLWSNHRPRTLFQGTLANGCRHRKRSVVGGPGKTGRCLRGLEGKVEDGRRLLFAGLLAGARFQLPRLPVVMPRLQRYAGSIPVVSTISTQSMLSEPNNERP